METKIWSHFIEILSFRQDLINICKPFMKHLKNGNNNQLYSINSEKYISFLKSFSKYQQKLLHKIIQDETYANIDQEGNSYQPINFNENEIMNQVLEIIKGDKLEELQRVIRERGIKSINIITTSFKEVEKMTIPILQFCLIEKAIKCFKYLLINGMDDPANTMQEQNPNPDNQNSPNIHRYEWNCITTSIYFGEMEIVKILAQETSIQLGDKYDHIHAAILSYRNVFVKELLTYVEEKDQTKMKKFLNLALFSSAQNNNINILMYLISKGANINSKNKIYYF